MEREREKVERKKLSSNNRLYSSNQIVFMTQFSSANTYLIKKYPYGTYQKLSTLVNQQCLLVFDFRFSLLFQYYFILLKVLGSYLYLQ